MSKKINSDFSGYATKNNVKCSDGRTIIKDAFKENDGQKVPLVWQHLHDSPDNILGHAILENREDGVYTYGFFNDSEEGKAAKERVRHGDINGLSIYANKLKQKGSDVIHGMIREVSLVLTGANPEAFIDNVNLEHGDHSIETLETEAIMYFGDTMTHSDNQEEEIEHKDDTGKETKKDKTVGEILDTLNEEQKNALYFVLGQAVENDIEHSEEGTEIMKNNVFDNTERDKAKKATLSHAQLKTILDDAQKCGSFKESFLAHAAEYGIEDIEYLFPDARTVTPTPEMIQRDNGWVNVVLNGTKHTPFSRIKSTAADITADEARAKGYVKGNLKKEEVIKLLKRVTNPTTIYKKQKLDRDDIIDITDLDVVAWLKAEMRLMLNEELARAILIGDGREVDDQDKINEENIRPIAYDVDLYSHKVEVAANVSTTDLVETIIRSRVNYKGSGMPTMFTTEAILTDMLLLKDKMGRRLYSTQAELVSALRVDKIVTVEVMEGHDDLIAILVNLRDYTNGADKGGNIGMFDDFDIDYNQYKYLIETRCSGALTKPKSAVVIKRAQGTLVTPVAPTFVSSTGVLTIPSKTGVAYYVDGVITSAGAQDPIANGVVVEIVAKPATGYYFPHNFDADWEFISELV